MVRIQANRSFDHLAIRKAQIKMPDRESELLVAGDSPAGARSGGSVDHIEASRYLPLGTEAELLAFAERQLSARRRLTALVDFYRKYDCRMAKLHLLAACAVVLGRLAGFSENFDQIGEAFMPVDSRDKPKNQSWQDFVDACNRGRPIQIRDELWLAAHMKDLNTVQSLGLDKAFYDEADLNPEEPGWRCARRHMEVTLGARLRDSSALAGLIPYETAMADSLGVTVKRLVTGGAGLLGRYGWEAIRAIILPNQSRSNGVMNYRRTAFGLLKYSVTCLSSLRLFWEGMRVRERGAEACSEGWPLISSVLAQDVVRVDPLIVSFYSNPSRFRVKATIELDTVPARFWSMTATLLVGQGLYETGLSDMEARFRVFKRADGSMHFIRELYSAGTRRVFDSDFVVRDLRGRPTLFEVFVDLGIDVEMSVRPLDDGGLSIKGVNIYFRGIRLPSTALKVEFISRVESSPDGRPLIRIEGSLLMQPDTRLGRFVIHRLLRRPEKLGRIAYLAEPALEASRMPDS